tara:strand:+ start:858 stop:1415 length:558 start_codon:yes stop_codon:yes gene_type:complete
MVYQGEIMADFVWAFEKKWKWGSAKRRDPKYWVECAEDARVARGLYEALHGRPYAFRLEHSEPINYKAYWQLREKGSLGFTADTFEKFVTVLSFFYPDKWESIRKEVVLELDKIKREGDDWDRGYYKAHAKGYRYGKQVHDNGHATADDATRAYMKSMRAKGYIGRWDKMVNLYTLLIDKYPFPF